MREPANNPVRDLQIINSNMVFETACKIEPNYHIIIQVKYLNKNQLRTISKRVFYHIYHLKDRQLKDLHMK